MHEWRGGGVDWLRAEIQATASAVLRQHNTAQIAAKK